jgi:uncharacterized protein DUF6265
MRLTNILVVLTVFSTSGTRRAAGNLGQQPARSTIESFAWLSGCWERRSPRGVTEEHWARPAGGTMIGFSRTVRRVADRDSTTEYEFLRVFVRDGKLVYAALPSAQRYTEFTETSATDSAVVFENPKHDFPQRITYTRRGADSVVARIDGLIQGRLRAINFPYVRVRCP